MGQASKALLLPTVLKMCQPQSRIHKPMQSMSDSIKQLRMLSGPFSTVQKLLVLIRINSSITQQHLQDTQCNLQSADLWTILQDHLHSTGTCFHLFLCWQTSALCSREGNSKLIRLCCNKADADSAKTVNWKIKLLLSTRVSNASWLLAQASPAPLWKSMPMEQWCSNGVLMF